MKGAAHPLCFKDKMHVKDSNWVCRGRFVDQANQTKVGDPHG
jgi:hypothetical protein